MPRKPSVILTATDKKVFATELKDAVRTAKSELARLVSESNALGRAHEKMLKAKDKAQENLMRAEAELTNHLKDK